MPAGDEPTGAHIDFLIEKSPVTSLPIQRGRISSWVSCLSSISAIVTPCADGHDRLPKMAADLVRHHVAVIATPLSTQAAIAVPTLAGAHSFFGKQPHTK
jgi:hypothetical protein